MTTTDTSPHGHDQEPEAMGEMDPFDTYKAPRPGPVTALAVLQVLSGVAAVAFVVLGSEGRFGEVSIPGFFSQQHVALAVLVGMVHIAAGVGMWLGKSWGWWLAAFSYLYSLLNNASTLLLVPDMVEAYREPARGAGYYYLRELFNIGWDVFILVYWFREGVLDYFGLLDLSRLKAFVGLIAVTILVAVAGYLLVGGADQELGRIAELYEDGDLVTAAGELDQYLESHPGDDLAWTVLGHIKTDMGAYEEAEAAYDRAIEIDPERGQAWIGLGILKDDLGDDEGAMECYEKALEIDADDPDAHSSIALLALELYQDGKALEHAEKAYELDKRNPDIAANLALVYHYSGMYEQRDEMTAKAEQLGFEQIELLQMIYEGLWLFRE
jgi:tetratricopeptide (TPR) repeat protein